MTPISLNTLMPTPQLMIQKKVATEEKIAPMSPSSELISSFSTAFQKHIEKVNGLLDESSELTRKLASGEIENIHTVMIAAEKARIALNFTLALRDRIIRAYEDTLAMGGR
ncbi:MAG: flagellar hook-basal body complex protein FliE [bacterium]